MFLAISMSVPERTAGGQGSFDQGYTDFKEEEEVKIISKEITIFPAETMQLMIRSVAIFRLRNDCFEEYTYFIQWKHSGISLF